MIPDTPRRAGPLNGNGVATSFPFTFKVFATGDAAVVRASAATSAEVLLEEGVDYSVTLNADQVNNPGGTITYPISGSPLPAGYTLTIYGDTDYTQSLSLTGASNFNPTAIENAMDRQVMQVQQLLERLNRTLTLAVSASTSTDLTVPAPQSNALIGWNPLATGLQNVDPSTLATLVAYGTAMRDYFTGDGVTTAFALSANPGALGNIDIDIDGVTQNGSADFTWAGGTTLTFAAAPPSGSKIQVRYLQALPVGTVGPATVGTTQLIDGAVTTSKLAAGAVTDAKIAGMSYSKLSGTPTTLGAGGYGVSATDVLIPRQLSAPSVTQNSGALTIGIAPETLDFRNATLTNGATSTVTSGALSLIVPTGATLGAVTTQQTRIAVLAINNAGTVELAVMNLSGGAQLDECGVISTAAISASATSASTAYSTTARANVPYRLVGFFDATNTAGAWGNPVLVQGAGGAAGAAMQSVGYGQTWQTPARAASVTYYNNTGRPIQVVATTILTGAGAAVSLIVNGVTIASQSSGGAAWAATMSAIVPPGASYMFQSNVGVSTWAELR